MPDTVVVLTAIPFVLVDQKTGLAMPEDWMAISEGLF